MVKTNYYRVPFEVEISRRAAYPVGYLLLVIVVDICLLVIPHTASCLRICTCASVREIVHNNSNKKLSNRQGTARCTVLVEILPIATQQCRNYLYDKS